MEIRGRMMMKPSSDSLFDQHDLQVADILLNLADSILKSEWIKAAVTPSWRVKRKRSTPLRNSSTLQLRSPPPLAPLLPSPSALPPPVGFEVKKKSVEVNAEVASSPNSILFFPPASTELSESDDKSNLCLSRSNSKKTREELVEEVHGLNRVRDMLRLEVEKVESHHDKLLARNTQLKSLKQQVLSSGAFLQGGGGWEQPQLEKPETKSGFGLDLSRPGQQWLQHIHHPTVMLGVSQPFITAGQVSQPLISYGFDPAQTWGYFHAKRAKYAEARMYRKNKRALK